MGGPNKPWNIHSLFRHSSWHLKIRVELCSRHYSREIMFIPASLSENTINTNNLIHNTINNIATLEKARTIHNILATPYRLFVPTSMSPSYFLSLFPWKARWWRPISNAQYRWEHNHATEIMLCGKSECEITLLNQFCGTQISTRPQNAGTIMHWDLGMLSYIVTPFSLN